MARPGETIYIPVFPVPADLRVFKELPKLPGKVSLLLSGARFATGVMLVGEEMTYQRALAYIKGDYSDCQWWISGVQEHELDCLDGDFPLCLALLEGWAEAEKRLSS